MLNDRIVNLARENPNLVVVDIEPLFRRYGEEKLTSPALWYAGRIRYTAYMFKALAKLIDEALRAYANKARKVLLLDLDGTLWGGIVGELGPTGIDLSEEGKGACYRDFQRQVKALKATGVLLAIVSKNNPADVDEVFEQNSLMIVRRDDFVSIDASWRSKPESILDVAETLNLGLDSFVFIDDNPVERAIVREALPEVVVPDFPTSVETLTRWFVEDVVRPYFGRYRITTEDLDKTQQYRANEARRRFAQDFDFNTFLDELQIVCSIKVDSPEIAVRASQMTQKQINLILRRNATKYRISCVSSRAPSMRL